MHELSVLIYSVGFGALTFGSWVSNCCGYVRGACALLCLGLLYAGCFSKWAFAFAGRDERFAVIFCICVVLRLLIYLSFRDCVFGFWVCRGLRCGCGL